MTIEEIVKLEPEDAWKKLSQKEERSMDLEDIEKQLDPKQHLVMQASHRPDKTVKKYAGKDNAGKALYEETIQKVNRVPIALQELIVERRVGFVLGNPVELQPNKKEGPEKDLYDMIDTVWDQSKLDYLNREIARTLFSETEVAELWYVVTDDEFWEKEGIKIRPKVKVLKPSEGNTLVPIFNEYDDMVAFSRIYSIQRGDDKIEVLETYTQNKIYIFEKKDDVELVDTKSHRFGKIPVVYYSQKLPEWARVQPLIERLEDLVSNFGDTNDYFGSPIVFLNGKVEGFASKGEQGKVLQGEKGSEAKYLSWDSAPDSVKLEIETLLELIYTLTQTPNISFSQMKGLGNLSGVALKMMFLDAHMKVENKIEILGEMFQRRLNLLKKICAVADVSLEKAVKTLKVAPYFTPYLPRNEKEEMETLNTGAGGKAVMSQRTAVKNNPYVQDADAEMDQIKEEANEERTREIYEA